MAELRRILVHSAQGAVLQRHLKMKAFRKKPVQVHAARIFRPFEVETLEGIMHGESGDWLIMGVEGELYPCKDSVFQATYNEDGGSAVFLDDMEFID